MLRSSAFLWIFVLGLAGLVAWQGATIDPALVAERSHYGFLSLVPALATLAICFATRNVILALFLGIVLGGLITTDYNIIQAFLIPSVGSERYAQILLVYLWALGGLLGMWNRNGGAWHFAQWISQKFVRSRRSALFFAWLMGIIFHQGGTISTVLTGTTVRPVADREKVAHEELAYVVDSTASPVATIIPFNVWPVYVAGLIAIPSMSHFIPDQDAAIGMFLRAIPFNFYGLLAVLFTLLFALGKLPFVGRAMRAAQRGFFVAKTQSKFRDVLDGLSNTIAGGEFATDLGDRAIITLMTYPDKSLGGRVDSLGWGISQDAGSTGPLIALLSQRRSLSSGPMNISYTRIESAPNSRTMSSGFTTLPRALLIL